MTDPVATSNCSTPRDGADLNSRRSEFIAFSELRKTLRDAGTTVRAMTRSDFVRHVTLHMPEVSAHIHEDDFGIAHLELGAMRKATRDAILAYELYTVRRHLSFIGYLYEHADDELRDAIQVSYLEALFIHETFPAYSRARRMLPATLDAALVKAEMRYAQLASKAAGFFAPFSDLAQGLPAQK